jgi:hypothetical protein
MLSTTFHRYNSRMIGSIENFQTNEMVLTSSGSFHTLEVLNQFMLKQVIGESLESLESLEQAQMANIV